MITFDGLFFDGHSSASTAVKVTVWPEFNCVNIKGGDIEREYPLDGVKISARVGNIPRRLILPGGASLETRNNAAVDTLALAQHSGRGNRLSLHTLETYWRWVLTALLATGLSVWLALTFAIPYLAEQVAHAIPLEMETEMGEQTLQALDNRVFSPTALSLAQQQRGQRLFAELLAPPHGNEAGRLEFRAMHGNVANALSLPSGIIVVTDRLMLLADKDEQLQAVLAHEIGHTHYRHSLRGWLQDSVSALVVAAVLGDVSSIAANVAVLPTVLLHNEYSRQFEEEADDYAAQIVQSMGISSCHLGRILNKLEATHAGSTDNVPSFLSTHPATEERVLRLAERERELMNLKLLGCGQQ